MAFQELEMISGFFPKWPIWVIVVVLIWSLVWKGFALWKAGRKNQPIWFVVLLIVNMIGILEILYIFVFSETNSKVKKKNKK